MKSLFMAFALLVGSLAQAQMELPGKITKIQADLRCEKSGRGIAVSFPRANSAGRVWHSEIGGSEGLELEVTSFKVARCPGCFEFEALLMGEKVVGKASNFNLVYSGVKGNGKLEELMAVQCVPEKQTASKGQISSDKAYLKVCPAVVEKSGKGMRLIPAAGCLNKIVINGTEAVVASDNDESDKVLKNIISTNQFHKVTKSQPFKVEGRMDKMMYMGYEREVFVVTSIDAKTVVLPKGM